MEVLRRKQRKRWRYRVLDNATFFFVCVAAPPSECSVASFSLSQQPQRKFFRFRGLIAKLENSCEKKRAKLTHYLREGL
jgi:hypothetical protein